MLLKDTHKQTLDKQQNKFSNSLEESDKMHAITVGNLKAELSEVCCSVL